MPAFHITKRDKYQILENSGQDIRARRQSLADSTGRATRLRWAVGAGFAVLRGLRFGFRSIKHPLQHSACPRTVDIPLHREAQNRAAKPCPPQTRDSRAWLPRRFPPPSMFPTQKRTAPDAFRPAQAFISSRRRREYTPGAALVRSSQRAFGSVILTK